MGACWTTQESQCHQVELSMLDGSLTLEVSPAAKPDHVVAQITAAVGEPRYLSEPATGGRIVIVRRLWPDGSVGPPAFRYRARPGEVVRVLQPCIHDPGGLADVLARELHLAERYGCSLMLDELPLDLVDTRDPDYSVSVNDLRGHR